MPKYTVRYKSNSTGAEMRKHFIARDVSDAYNIASTLANNNTVCEFTETKDAHWMARGGIIELFREALAAGISGVIARTFTMNIQRMAIGYEITCYFHESGAHFGNVVPVNFFDTNSMNDFNFYIAWYVDRCAVLELGCDYE